MLFSISFKRYWVVSLTLIAPAAADCWEAKLLPTSSPTYNFRWTVAISGDHVLAGGVPGDPAFPSTLPTFLYRKHASGWLLEAELAPPDPSPSKNFGIAIALSRDFAIVGASRDSERASRAGAVYVFQRDGATWRFQQKLTANDPANSAFFGNSVSLDGDRLVVGAAGSYVGGVYVFRRGSSGWVQEAKLRPSSYPVGPVDVAGDRILVGIPDDNLVACQWCTYGSAFIYHFDGINWRKEQYLYPGSSLFYDRFGTAVDFHGQRAIVGTGGDSRGVYQFQQLNAAWIQVEELSSLVSDFGGQVAQSDQFVFVGSSNGVFAFDVNKQANHIASTPSYQLLPGQSIRGLAADVHQAVASTDSGAVYIFDLQSMDCRTDCNANAVDDSVEFYSGVAGDCNRNGVLDACDPDCNGNGVPDSCDTYAYWLYDCNRNGVVDACDIEFGTSQDCSGDGYPDECDRDCNSNGVPDSCDIVVDTSRDEDANTVPDECETWTQCQSSAGVFDYAKHRANVQAEIMAMLASNQLRAPDELYDRIDRDMKLMETAYPLLKTVGRWRIGTKSMYVVLDPSKPSNGFDELNSFYQAVSIVPSRYDPNARHIEFCDRLNIQVLRSYYQALPEITYTEGGVDSTYNFNSDYITLETHGSVFIYEYSNGGGDCPSGCTCRQSWQLATTPAGQIALLSYSPGPSVCDVPNDGDFDGDGVIDYEDPCPAGEIGEGDSDDDGVNDPCDACPNTISSAAVDLRGCTPGFPGDYDRDGDIGLDDFAHFVRCLTGPFLPPSCYEVRADNDIDVDLKDFAVLQRCSRGGSVLAQCD